MDDSFLAATLVFDIKKAFDTIEHAILFGKLENVRIRGIALELVRSYLLEEVLQFMLVRNHLIFFL